MANGSAVAAMTSLVTAGGQWPPATVTVRMAPNPMRRSPSSPIEGVQLGVINIAKNNPGGRKVLPLTNWRGGR